MARVIISNQRREQIVELRYASNITWRKAINSIGYASFDLPLSDPFCNPTYLNPGNYIHIFNDTANSNVFADADFAGLLSNDYELKPKDGVVTVQAAGLTQMLELSIVDNTASYTSVDVGTMVLDLLTNHCDNWTSINLTQYTAGTFSTVVENYTAGWGDTVWSDVSKICADYGVDFEVRPDFSYGLYVRQGADNPNLIVRYGEQGNVQVDTTMHVVNTEMANQVWWTSSSGFAPVLVVNQTSAQFYGKRTVVIQDPGNSYTSEDLLTKAELEVAKRAFPLTMMDHVVIVDSPLLPFDRVRIGDRVLFEAPSLPILESFNGLQRILAVEYDDRKRTMDLTLGNALYTVLRGKLHEVRLYTSNG